jgi:hypothetical protein
MLREVNKEEWRRIREKISSWRKKFETMQDVLLHS